MAQYDAIKNRHQDAILFYRMGDFYEMFYGDADKAASLLEIALTSRNKNEENPIPMCGVPVRTAETYIAKLIKKGCKVAVCEQVEDPATAKGLVKREVVKVVTPGMILNEALLDRRSHNFLLALAKDRRTAGISFLDISTGSFHVTESALQNGRIPPALIDEVMRVDPSEIIMPVSLKNEISLKPVVNAFSNRQITWLDSELFQPDTAGNVLLNKFNTRSLKGFGCETLTSGLTAAGAVISYVKETQQKETKHVKALKPYTLGSYLVIDDRSCRNLELVKNLQTGEKKGSLLGILDQTVTAMGSRLLKTWIKYPLLQHDRIEKRLTAVSDAASSSSLRSEIRAELKQVYDLERLGSKISMKQCNARDLVALKNSLYRLPGLFKQLENFSSDLLTGNTAKELAGAESVLSGISSLVDEAVRDDAVPVINEGGIIREGYSGELDEIVRMSRGGKKWILEAEAQEKKKTGLSSLKIKYNKVFGYFIEVSKTQAAKVPDTYIKKQTLVNSERFITEEIKKAETDILHAQEKRAALEYSLFCDIRDKIAEEAHYIIETAAFIARVDVLLSFAQTAQDNNYTRPHINDADAITIKEGRHPVVEKTIEGERYVPNTIRMDNSENQILLITGPNMAGKSTVLRQVALTSLMAQAGSFVPADEASLCIVDRIFTRVGALDNLSQGQSTFMVEMEETADIVNNASSKSLVVLDEIGRGTSTYDGMSIAWAVVEYLHNLEGRGVKTLFATHYHELTELEERLPRVKNFNIAVKEFNDNIIFLRQLVRGGTNKSYGIQVARLAGVPDDIIARAKKVLSGVETISRQEEKPAGKQRELFNNSGDDAITDMLKGINISAITPLEALNLLNDMKTKTEKP